MPTYSAILSGPAGNIELQNPGIYKLEASTRADRSVTQRKITAGNPFVEGEFTVHSVRENVTEAVSVYVYASSAGVLRQRINEVCNALDQVHYTLAFKTDTDTETWTCMAAEYSIRQQHEFQHSYMALISASIPRLPKVVYT